MWTTLWLLPILFQTCYSVDTYIAIHNLTPFTLTRSAVSANTQYDKSLKWTEDRFPATIDPGTVAECHVSAEIDLLTQAPTDQPIIAAVTYTVGDDSVGSIDIYLRNQALYLGLSNLKRFNTVHGTDYELGWEASGGKRTPVFLAGGQEESIGIFSNYLSPSWMRANSLTIGCQPLRRLVWIGSHDAGMSEFNAHTSGAAKYDTLTQTLNIYDQLRAGVRQFDIRPVISGGHYYTGHYSKVLGIFQGADGQRMEDVIDNINQYTSETSELIILNFGSSSDTDGDYSTFSYDQWNDFMTYMTSRLNYVISHPEVTDLTEQTLDWYIDSGPAVILLNEDGGHGQNEPLNGTNGFYDIHTYFKTTGTYSDDIDAKTVRRDQEEKLWSNRQSPDDDLFGLWWTLTTGLEAQGILAWAEGFYTQMFKAPRYPLFPIVLDGDTGIFGMTDNQTYPNVIWMDNIKPDAWPAMLAQSMNRYYAVCPKTSSSKMEKEERSKRVNVKKQVRKCSKGICNY